MTVLILPNDWFSCPMLGAEYTVSFMPHSQMDAL